MTRPALDLCVLGAGAAGLSVAYGAAQMGARVALVERAEMGGECLNSGCVPSKALLAAARWAAAPARAAPFGVTLGPASIDPVAVFAHLRATIDKIAPMDSIARFEGAGVEVHIGEARFRSPDVVVVDCAGRGEVELKARRFVVATGSTPAIPPIPGLAETPFLTNETLFGLAKIPRRLAIVGGGPIGVEMSMAFRRLGAAVDLIERDRLLPRDDLELVEVVRQALRRAGVAVREGARMERVAPSESGVEVVCATAGGGETIAASHLLVAVGRAPRVEGLNLASAGVDFEERGIPVDRRLRTSNHRIFAVGDVVAGAPRFTHAASLEAGVALRNALFRWPARIDYRALPWVTFSDPELASVGLTEVEAAAEGRPIRVLRAPFAENDRAVAELAEEGLLKVVVTPRGKILGAAIVGRGAGELILPWALAVSGRLSLGALAQAVIPYPTLSEVTKRAAGSFYAPTVFGPRVRWLVRQLARLG